MAYVQGAKLVSLVPRKDVFPAGVKGIKEGFLEAMTFQLAIGGQDRVQGSHFDFPPGGKSGTQKGENQAATPVARGKWR